MTNTIAIRLLISVLTIVIAGTGSASAIGLKLAIDPGKFTGKYVVCTFMGKTNPDNGNKIIEPVSSLVDAEKGVHELTIDRLGKYYIKVTSNQSDCFGVGSWPQFSLVASDSDKKIVCTSQESNGLKCDSANNRIKFRTVAITIDPQDSHSDRWHLRGVGPFDSARNPLFVKPHKYLHLVKGVRSGWDTGYIMELEGGAKFFFGIDERGNINASADPQKGHRDSICPKVNNRDKKCTYSRNKRRILQFKLTRTLTIDGGYNDISMHFGVGLHDLETNQKISDPKDRYNRKKSKQYRLVRGIHSGRFDVGYRILMSKGSVRFGTDSGKKRGAVANTNDYPNSLKILGKNNTRLRLSAAPVYVNPGTLDTRWQIKHERQYINRGARNITLVNQVPSWILAGSGINLKRSKNEVSIGAFGRPAPRIIPVKISSSLDQIFTVERAFDAPVMKSFKANYGNKDVCWDAVNDDGSKLEGGVKASKSFTKDKNKSRGKSTIKDCTGDKICAIRVSDSILGYNVNDDCARKNGVRPYSLYAEYDCTGPRHGTKNVKQVCTAVHPVNKNTFNFMIASCHKRIRRCEIVDVSKFLTIP